MLQLNEKNEALAHQKLAAQILADQVRSLEACMAASDRNNTAAVSVPSNNRSTGHNTAAVGMAASDHNNTAVVGVTSNGNTGNKTATGSFADSANGKTSTKLADKGTSNESASVDSGSIGMAVGAKMTSNDSASGVVVADDKNSKNSSVCCENKANNENKCSSNVENKVKVCALYGNNGKNMATSTDNENCSAKDTGGKQ